MYNARELPKSAYKYGVEGCYPTVSDRFQIIGSGPYRIHDTWVTEWYTGTSEGGDFEVHRHPIGQQRGTIYFDRAKAEGFVSCLITLCLHPDPDLWHFKHPSLKGWKDNVSKRHRESNKP